MRPNSSRRDLAEPSSSGRRLRAALRHRSNMDTAVDSISSYRPQSAPHPAIPSLQANHGRSPPRALRAGTYRLVEVEAGIPNRIPQFVGELVELLVGQRVRLVDDRQIKIGTGAHLATANEPTAPRPMPDCGTSKETVFASLVPQLFDCPWPDPYGLYVSPHHCGRRRRHRADLYP